MECFMILNYDKCKHCKYFIQHYVIDIDFVHTPHCGHCIKNISTTGGYRIYSGKQPCSYFEQNRGQEVKVQKRSIEKLLNEMSLNLEYIKLFLNKNKAKQEISDSMLNNITNKIKY